MFDSDLLHFKYNDNSSITRTEYNALARAAKSNIQASFAFHDGDTLAGQYDKINLQGGFPISADIDIPPFSIFTLKQDPTNTTVPLLVQAAKIGTDGWRPMLLDLRDETRY